MTIITAIVYEKMPTGLQIAGLVSGIVGVLFIVFQKKKPEGEEEEEANSKTAEKKDENHNNSANIDVP